MLKVSLKPLPNPVSRDLNNLECTLSQEASTLVSPFLA